MIPAIGNKVEFKYDKAFNYRMTAMVIKNGDVPEIDRLSTYPDGKNIKAFLPTGMYEIAGKLYNLVNAVKPISYNRFILLFTSIAASLICIPIYFLSYEIYNNKPVAYISAILAGVIPAYLHRFMCYWYRYEAVATPILFVSLLFLAKAFAVSDNKRISLYSFLSAIFMALANAEPIVLPQDRNKNGLSKKMKRKKIKSSLIMPFSKANTHEAYGVISLNVIRKDREFSKKDLAIVRELTNLSSIALAPVR